MTGWYIRRGEKIVGPVEPSKLRELVADGRLHPSDHLAKDITGPWNEASHTALFAERVKIKKGVLGGHTVSYDCPQCSASLKSPIDEAGKADTCPECGRQFIVPGATVRDRIHAEEASAKEQKRKIKEEEQSRQLQLKLQKEQALVAQRPEAQANLEVVRQEQPPETNTDKRPCPFCGEEIFAIAKKCKHCGEFLDGDIPLQRSRTQTVELTGKRWKLAQLLGVLGILLGSTCVFIAFGTKGDPKIAIFGFLSAVLGSILYMVARIGAWWFHG